VPKLGIFRLFRLGEKAGRGERQVAQPGQIEQAHLDPVVAERERRQRVRVEHAPISPTPGGAAGRGDGRPLGRVPRFQN